VDVVNRGEWASGNRITQMNDAEVQAPS